MCLEGLRLPSVSPPLQNNVATALSGIFIGSFHAYEDRWEPVIGHVHPYIQKPDNPEDETMSL